MKKILVWVLVKLLVNETQDICRDIYVLYVEKKG